MKDEDKQNNEKRWASLYESYIKFKEEFDKDPQFREEYEGVKLGNWVNNQRKNYKKGKLDVTKVDLLNQAGFVWNPLELSWQTNFELYKMFKEEFSREPESREEYEGLKLGFWCNVQRQAYKKGALDNTKVDLLNQAGFVWDLLELSWQTNFELYKKFKEEFNREPKQMEEYKGIKLGRWCNSQRQGKKGYRRITSKQIQLLDDIGFRWSVEGRLRKQITETLKSINDPSVLKDIINFIESRIK
tara:strand:+ start:287 stop:1018 length:732 start_codon:yes stop_codon:yes gene_type:complete